MSKLRNQLGQARDAYRNERYPGDLASEILSPPRRKLPVGWVIGVATTFVAGMAAVVALYIGNINLNVNPPSEVAIVTTPAPDLTAIPEVPSDLSLIPQAESISEIALRVRTEVYGAQGRE